MKILVLDEADRILDLGFSTQLKAVLSYLPQSSSNKSSSSKAYASSSSSSMGGGGRQTLLFSATQTKSVRALARLSMSKDAEYISVHGGSSRGIFGDKNGGDDGGGDGKMKGKKGNDGKEEEDDEEEFATPAKLQQHSMVCGEGEKMDCVFSFIKAHLRSKSIIFFATCAQVINF